MPPRHLPITRLQLYSRDTAPDTGQVLLSFGASTVTPPGGGRQVANARRCGLRNHHQGRHTLSNIGGRLTPVLKITRQQMDLFQTAQQRRFEDALIARLRENFAPVVQQHGLDDDRLRQIIQRGLARAREHQIVSEYDVTRFIEYAFEYGGRFESLPWAAPVLRASHLSGAEKMDRLDAISTFVLRDAAASSP